VQACQAIKHQGSADFFFSWQDLPNQTVTCSLVAKAVRVSLAQLIRC